MVLAAVQGRGERAVDARRPDPQRPRRLRGRGRTPTRRRRADRPCSVGGRVATAAGGVGGGGWAHVTQSLDLAAPSARVRGAPYAAPPGWTRPERSGPDRPLATATPTARAVRWRPGRPSARGSTPRGTGSARSSGWPAPGPRRSAGPRAGWAGVRLRQRGRAGGREWARTHLDDAVVRVGHQSVGRVRVEGDAVDGLGVRNHRHGRSRILWSAGRGGAEAVRRLRAARLCSLWARARRTARVVNAQPLEARASGQRVALAGNPGQGDRGLAVGELPEWRRAVLLAVGGGAGTGRGRPGQAGSEAGARGTPPARTRCLAPTLRQEGSRPR